MRIDRFGSGQTWRRVARAIRFPLNPRDVIDDHTHARRRATNVPNHPPAANRLRPPPRLGRTRGICYITTRHPPP